MDVLDDVQSAGFQFLQPGILGGAVELDQVRAGFTDCPRLGITIRFDLRDALQRVKGLTAEGEGIGIVDGLVLDSRSNPGWPGLRDPSRSRGNCHNQ